MDTQMAKTDAKSNGAAVPAEQPVAGGKLTIKFLKTTEIPERKPLGRAAGSGQWQELVDALKDHPGQLAEVYHSTDAKECNSRRTALINAANAKGVEMNMKKTAVRDSGNKDAEGKTVYTLFAMVADDATKKAQAKERAEKQKALEALAKEKGFKTVEDYKASLPKRGRRAATESEQNPPAQA